MTARAPRLSVADVQVGDVVTVTARRGQIRATGPVYLEGGGFTAKLAIHIAVGSMLPIARIRQQPAEPGGSRWEIIPGVQLVEHQPGLLH